MPSDESNDRGTERNTSSQKSAPFDIQHFSLPQFAVQLQNIIPTEVVARRLTENTDFSKIPETSNPPSVQLSLGEPVIYTETQQAQVSMEVHVTSTDTPSLFDISFKLVGLFTLKPNYSKEIIQQFLQYGSLSVMLPSARELLLSICTRLQLPLIVLPLIQLAPPPDDSEVEDVS